MQARVGCFRTSELQRLDMAYGGLTDCEDRADTDGAGDAIAFVDSSGRGCSSYTEDASMSLSNGGSLVLCSDAPSHPSPTTGYDALTMCCVCDGGDYSRRRRRLTDGAASTIGGLSGSCVGCNGCTTGGPIASTEACQVAVTQALAAVPLTLASYQDVAMANAPPGCMVDLASGNGYWNGHFGGSNDGSFTTVCDFPTVLVGNGSTSVALPVRLGGDGRPPLADADLASLVSLGVDGYALGAAAHSSGVAVVETGWSDDASLGVPTIVRALCRVGGGGVGPNATVELRPGEGVPYTPATTSAGAVAQYAGYTRSASHTCGDWLADAALGYTWTTAASNVAGSTGAWQTVALSGVGGSADVTAVRVWGNSAATAWGISLWEVRVLDGGGATLTPSGASASYEEGWNSAANAIDGDETGTRWATNGSPEANDWLLLTFVSPGVLPASVQLLWEGAYASSFDIEVGRSIAGPTAAIDASWSDGSDARYGRTDLDLDGCMRVSTLKTRPVWPRMAEACGCPGPDSLATEGDAWWRPWPN